MTSNNVPILYSYFRSSCSWRVRIALALKKIPYEYRAVNLVKNDQHSENFVAINPSHLVPTLMIDGVTLGQSVAIIEYLEETRPHVCPLLPKEASQRALARELVMIIASDIQPIQNLRVLQMMGEKKAEWAKHW
eukprot:Sdes_comp21690_c0_seq1m20267